MEGVRERWSLEERGEDGRRAEGEAESVGDYVVLTGAWESDVARYEVVGVYGGRGFFEDVVQASAGEGQGFGRCDEVDFI